MANRKVLLAVAATLYFISTTASATADPVKNIVLVHGAWVDESGWEPVYEILRGEGFNVTMVQEPETSFADDVTATKRILDLQATGRVKKSEMLDLGTTVGAINYLYSNLRGFMRPERRRVAAI